MRCAGSVQHVKLHVRADTRGWSWVGCVACVGAVDPLCHLCFVVDGRKDHQDSHDNHSPASEEGRPASVSISQHARTQPQSGDARLKWAKPRCGFFLGGGAVLCDTGGLRLAALQEEHTCAGPTTPHSNAHAAAPSTTLLTFLRRHSLPPSSLRLLWPAKNTRHVQNSTQLTGQSLRRRVNPQRGLSTVRERERERGGGWRNEGKVHHTSVVSMHACKAAAAVCGISPMTVLPQEWCHITAPAVHSARHACSVAVVAATHVIALVRP